MVNEVFKKPDLNAPRYRPTKLNLLNAEFYKRFRKKNPKYEHLTDYQIKTIITTFNGDIYKTVIDNRDGVELPEQLGYLFIGTCPKKIRDNPDFKRSFSLNIRVQNQNWESDAHVAKIFYTNIETKYRFRFYQLWSFTALRDFKRAVAHTYPKQWKMYVMAQSTRKISQLHREYRNQEFRATQTAINLQSYDELLFD